MSVLSARRHAARSIVLSIGLCAALSGHALAQVRVITLETPDVELAAPFTYIGGARELSGGRALVLDRGEKQLWLVDLTAKTRTIAGTSGIGALEYATPVSVIPAGRESLVYDFATQHILVFSSEAIVREAIDAAALDRSLDRGSPLHGADNLGRLYFDGSSISLGPDGARPLDSTAILRFDRAARRVDTIAFIHPPRGSIQASGGRPGESLSILTGADNPFAPHDTWITAPSGRVAIVHASPYRIEWIAADRKRTLGPIVDVEPIPVTDADKATAHAFGGASTGSSTRGGAQGRTDWPASKAAFPHGDAQVDPRGFVWVRRSTAAGDEHGRYDVFDETGRLSARFVLPPRTRVVGFGSASLFAKRATDEGERLELFHVARWP